MSKKITRSGRKAPSQKTGGRREAPAPSVSGACRGGAPKGRQAARAGTSLAATAILTQAFLLTGVESTLPKTNRRKARAASENTSLLEKWWLEVLFDALHGRSPALHPRVSALLRKRAFASAQPDHRAKGRKSFPDKSRPQACAASAVSRANAEVRSSRNPISAAVACRHSTTPRSGAQT